MWQDIIDNKDEWIGGVLYEFGCEQVKTKIKDIRMEEEQDADGKPYYMFTVVGEDFTMRGNTQYFGVGGQPQFNGLPLRGTYTGGDSWEITKKEADHA